jgi:hypothetical protein
MPAPPLSAADRLRQSSRLPAPGKAHRTAELTAACAVLAVVAHLVLAPVTAILACCALAVARLSRWHPLWLAVPAAGGATTAAAVGLGRALAGFAAGPRQVIGDLAGAAGHPGRLAQLPAALAGTGHLLPAQFSVALVLASAEAALAGWLVRRTRPTIGGVLPEPGWRPGLIVVTRRRLTAATLAAGHAATRDGAAVGLDPASGRPAEVTWAQAEGGVLTVAATPAAALLAGFPLAAAAIARRKALIVIDLAGSPWLPRSLAAVCGSAGVPLSCPGGQEAAGRLGPASTPGEAELASPAADIQAAIRDRAVVLFSAGPEAGPDPAATARRAVADLAAVLDEFGSERLRADCLAWVHVGGPASGPGGAAVGPGGGEPGPGDPVLVGLPGLGGAAGTVVLLSAASKVGAASLAQAVRVVVASGPIDQELARRLAELAPFRSEEDRQATAELLRWQDEDELALLWRGPAGRLQAGRRQVPGPPEWQS